MVCMRTVQHAPRIMRRAVLPEIKADLSVTGRKLYALALLAASQLAVLGSAAAPRVPELLPLRQLAPATEPSSRKKAEGAVAPSTAVAEGAAGALRACAVALTCAGGRRGGISIKFAC